MRLALLLATTVAIGAGATSDQCSFTDSRGLAQSTCTANGNHRLACAGTDKITSGQDSFDNIVCSGAEWYGLNCDGKVVVLGASVDVSCPFTCGTTCASDDITGQAPITSCHDGREMKSCEDGDLSIETESGAISYSKAVCLGGDQWLGFSCDGSVQKFAGSLIASCPPAACDPTPFATGYQNDPLTAPTLSGGVYSCPANQALLRKDPRPIAILSATCVNGLYRVNSTLSVPQIGCFPCDQPDGDWTESSSDVKPVLKNCILSCPEAFKLQRYLHVTERKYVTRMNRVLVMGSGSWYDEAVGEFLSAMSFECHPVSGNCPPITDMPVAACEAYGPNAVGKCRNATITSAEVTCPGGGTLISSMTSVLGMDPTVISLQCVGTKWQITAVPLTRQFDQPSQASCVYL